MKLSVIEFLRSYGKALWLPFALWTSFILLSLGFTWQFNPGQFLRSGFLVGEIPLLATVYYSWLVVTFFIGFSLANGWVRIENRTALWLTHLTIAIAIALTHLALVVLCFWLYKPVGPDFNPVFPYFELLYKWLIVEIAFYFLLLAYWEHILRTRRLISVEHQDLVIKTTDGLLKCHPQQISWMLADGNYVQVHCMGETHKTRNTLAAMEKAIGEGFYRAHRSVLVNEQDIHQVAGNRLILKDGKKLPISQSRRSELLKAIQAGPISHT